MNPRILSKLTPPRPSRVSSLESQRLPARDPRPETGREGGFSLVELLVSLLILTLILVAVLTLFDRSTRIARAQTQIADMQQAVRVSQHQLVRTVRMAGRGGLPMLRLDEDDPPTVDVEDHLLPRGVAVAVRNNVEEGALVAPDFPGSPAVAERTDVLTVRGVLNGSLYQLDPAAPGSRIDPEASRGAISVPALSPTGVRQPLSDLCDQLLDDGGGALPTALVLVGVAGEETYAVVEAAGVEGCGGDGGGTLSVRYDLAGIHAASYRQLSPAAPGADNGTLPPHLRAVAYLGVLEEYRYYIREDPAPAALRDDAVPVRRLSRARVYPNTDRPFAGSAQNLRQDLADDIVDLQVALGVENRNQALDPDEMVTENVGDGGEVDPAGDDEWLFNSAADDAGDVCKWNGVGGDACAGGVPHRLYYLRVTTLGRTGQPDPTHQDPEIGAIEDRPYAALDADRDQRMYRRWRLTTVVDLRNLS